MASTYSTTLRLELIGQGEQSGTWGVTTNNNFGALVEQAITGVQTITMNNTQYILSSFDGAVDESRNAVLVVNGTNITAQNLVAPAVEKLYTIRNISGANVTIKTSSGNGIAVSNNSYVQVYCDGTDFYNATPSVNNITGDLAVSGNETVGGNLTVTGTLSAGTITGLGKTIRQVVSSTASGSPTTSSSSFQPTGHLASITPSSTSSQIIVMWFGALAQPQYLGTETYALAAMFRNGTQTAAITGISVGAVPNAGGAVLIAVTTSGSGFSYVDFPTTTSPLTYQMYYSALGGGQCTYNDLTGSVITLLEIL
jgi:hypothetical protein